MERALASCHRRHVQICYVNARVMGVIRSVNGGVISADWEVVTMEQLPAELWQLGQV